MTIKLEELTNKLETYLNQSNNKNGLFELDFEFNLLLTAAQSYRHETVLKPFPSIEFTTTPSSSSNNEKTYDLLMDTLLSMPPCVQWKTKLNKLNTRQLALIDWLLTQKSYKIQQINDLNDDNLKTALNTFEGAEKPNYIFEIKYNDEKNRKFESLKQSNGVQYAFHGSRFENFYSILNSGLLSHFNKNSLFGEGTYLSQDATISLHYSPSCKTWDNSIIGQRMSCLLLCETIVDPQHVKTGTKDVKNSKVPEKYFVVHNNDYVRVKYMLVYAEKRKIKKTSKLQQYIQDNKFLLLVISYCLLLVFIGLMNSRAFHKYIKLSYEKLSSYLLGDAYYEQ